MSIMVNAFNTLSKCKPVKFLTGAHAPAAIATVTALSGITKDALNCVYYVHQSLNNDRIPEGQRTFVAGLDLSNGILNVITQAAATWGFTKFIKNTFDEKIAPKYFSDELVNTLKTAHKLAPEAAQSLADTLKGSAKAGLIAFSTLFITQIFAKRVIVPLIATPMATYFKKKFDKGNGTQQVKEPQQDTVAITNNEQLTKHAEELKENLPECFKTFVK